MGTAQLTHKDVCDIANEKNKKAEKQVQAVLERYPSVRRYEKV